MGRRSITFEVSVNERKQLDSMCYSRLLPDRLTRRAKIILMAADGHPTANIAAQCGVTPAAVTYWKKRFAMYRLAALDVQTRPGRPRMYADDAVTELRGGILQGALEDSTRRNQRAAARHSGLSKGSVTGYLALLGLRPHRAGNIRLSDDPLFVSKVRKIVGLHLSRSSNVLALCVDENAPVLVAECTQPSKGTAPGYANGSRSRRIRGDATTLLSALNAAAGEIVAQRIPRHPATNFIAFLNHIDLTVHPNLDVHLVVDNDPALNDPEIRLWLTKRTRYHVHVALTYSNWLTQVERWFGIVTQWTNGYGALQSVRMLVAAIRRHITQYSYHGRTFTWTASTDSVLATISHFCESRSEM